MNKRDLKVCAITPTLPNRSHLLERVKRMVKAQTYPCQHIILPGDGSIGSKLNHGVQASSADIFVRFDDDDFYSNDYVSKCVEALQDCDTTGLSSGYFTDGNTAWLYEWKGGQQLVLGSGMAFWRRIWERNRFKNVNSGEDTIFCANAGIIKPHGYINGFLATIHGNNTASHHALPFMKQVDMSELPMIGQQAFQ